MLIDYHWSWFDEMQDNFDSILLLMIHFIYRNTFSEYYKGGEQRNNYLSIIYNN